MTVLRDILARFGIEAETGPLEDLDRGIGGVVGKLQQMGAALAAGTAVVGLRNFVEEMANAGDELDKTSQRLGLDTDALQAWRHAATLSGVGAEQFNAAISTLQRSALGAATGQAEMARNFRALGIDVRNSEGDIRSTDEMLLLLADGLHGIEDPTRRAGMAMRILGESGGRLLPLFANGAEGVQAMRAELEALGGGASREFVANSAAFNDQLTRMDLAMFSLKSRLANLLLPAFTRTVTVSTDLISNFTSMVDRSHGLEAALVVLGGAAIAAGVSMSAAWAGPILVTAAIALSIGFLILLVDDLITLFSGGRSVIGGFLDEIFGVGTAAEVVQYLTDAWEGLTLAIGEAFDAVTRFFGVSVETAGGEPLTSTRGFDPATGISAEEDEFRRMVAGATRGEHMDPAERVRITAAYRARTGGEAEARFGDTWGTELGATTPTPTAAAMGASLVIDSPVTVNLPPGTPRDMASAVATAVDERLDARNREAAAALGSEAVEE